MTCIPDPDSDAADSGGVFTGLRARLHALAFFAVLVVAVAAAGVIAAGHRVDAAADAQARAQEADHEAAGLVNLTLEYAHGAGPRSAQQWRQRQVAIAALVEDGAHLPGRPESAAPPQLRSLAAALPALFSRVEPLPAPADGFGQRRREALLDQLLANAQALSDDAHRWALDAGAAHALAQRDFRWVAYGAPACVALLVVAAALLVRRRVLAPVERMREAVAAARGGLANVRIGSRVPDELGALGREFDRMAAAVAEAARRRDRAEQRLRAIADQLPVMVSCLDRDGRHQFVNRATWQSMGLDERQVDGMPLRDCLGSARFAARAPHLARALGGERVQFELEESSGDATRLLQCVYLPQREADGSVAGVYTFATDVTAMRRLEERLLDFVRADPVTGLPNRRQFDELMPQALARARRAGAGLALMRLALDPAPANAEEPDAVRDEAMLKAFARRVAESVRSTDSVVRLDGDDFAVVLEGLHSEAEPALVAQKILANVARSLDVAGRATLPSACVGIVHCRRPPVAGEDEGVAARMLERAGYALQGARQLGRGTWRQVELGEPAQFELVEPMRRVS